MFTILMTPAEIEVVGEVKASLIESDHVANLKYGFKDFSIRRS